MTATTSELTLSERVKTLPERATDMTTEQIAAEVRENWRQIVQENESQEALVPPEAFQQWRRFFLSTDSGIRAAQSRDDLIQSAGRLSGHRHEDLTLAPPVRKTGGVLGALRRALAKVFSR